MPERDGQRRRCQTGYRKWRRSSPPRRVWASRPASRQWQEQQRRNFDDLLRGDCFPLSVGTIGLTSRTHKEYPFLTCLSVTTQDTRTWRSPFRSCAPGYRRGTALARGGWCAVKEHPLTEDTSFHAKLYKEAPYFQPGENGDTRKRPDE